MPIKEKDFKYLNRGGVVHKDGTPAAPIQKVLEVAPTMYGDNNPTVNATPTVTPTTTVPTLSEYLASQVNAITGAYQTIIDNIDARNEQAIKDNEEIRKKAISYAEGQKLAAEEAAGIQRQRDVIDAANAYERNKATYGAKAEALADMGLTGGGYSDYLDAQAYATQRGDVQAAIGRETESLRLATNAYNDAVNKAYYDEAVANQTANISAGEQKTTAEISKNTAVQTANDAAASYNDGIFTNILDKISTGAISADQIESLASLYGMNEEQKKAWLDAANKYDSDKAEAPSNTAGAYADLLAGVNTGAYTKEQAEELANSLGLTEPEKESVIAGATKYEEEASKNIYGDIVSGIKAGDFYELSEIDKMGLTPEDAAKAKAEQNKFVYNAIASALNGDTKVEELNADFEEVEDLYRTGRIDEPTYNEIKGLLNTTPQGLNYQYQKGDITSAQYVQKMKAAGYETSASIGGGWYLQGLGRGSTVDDIDLTIGGTSRDSKNEFDLRCGNEVTKPVVISQLNRLATGNPNNPPSDTSKNTSSKENDGKIVCYNGALYVYTKKGWRTVVSDSDNVDDAIAAWMNASVSSKKIPKK